MKSIAAELCVSYQTVRKFVHGGSFPERARKARGHTPLDAHLQYIERRVTQGCRHPQMIWREVRERGYTGSRASVQTCVVRLLFPQGKPALIGPESTARTMPCPSARRAFGWLVGWRKLAVVEESKSHTNFKTPLTGEMAADSLTFTHAASKAILRLRIDAK
jgi:hypothetical protein